MARLDEVREGVRLGVRDALAAEVDRTAGATAARVATAGVLGFLAATALVGILLSSASQQPGVLWLTVCTAVWTTLLVVAFALVLLRVGTPRRPIADAAALGLVGLGVVTLLGFVCPDPMLFLGLIERLLGGMPEGHAAALASSLCLGLCVALIAGAGASLALLLRGRAWGAPWISAAAIFALLWPAVLVRSSELAASRLAGWSLGLALGSLVGVGLGLLVRAVARRAARLPAAS